MDGRWGVKGVFSSSALSTTGDRVGDWTVLVGAVEVRGPEPDSRAWLPVTEVRRRCVPERLCEMEVRARLGGWGKRRCEISMSDAPGLEALVLYRIVHFSAGAVF